MKTVRQTNVGKSTLRLLKTTAGFSGVVILNGAIKSRIEGTDADDVWTRLHNEAAKGSPNYFGFDGARSRFLRIFGGGFASPSYADHERRYKVVARDRLLVDAPLEVATSSSGLGETVLRIFHATNLLSPFEKMRIKDALLSRDADDFIRGAAAFTLGDAQALQHVEKALRPYDAAKWTCVTYLPFLWRPDRHMFLKPEVTKEFASRVGHRFAHDYSPKLDAKVYASLLDLAATMDNELADLRPADRIDIQSFIWVVGEYTAEDEAEVPSAVVLGQ